MKRSYYETQLQDMVNLSQTSPEVPQNFKVASGLTETKWMAVNLESMEILKAYAEIMIEILEERE
jgi:hypothetical protein